MSTEGGEPLWSIVLAGGEGKRLRPFTELWLGRHVPKQYCSFWGGERTLLHDALDRAEGLSGATRTITVVAREHRAFAETIFGNRRGPSRVVSQPKNADTAAGIYFPLTYIRRLDPGAVVVIVPSDHFVRPEARFLATAQAAMQAARDLDDQVILIGAVPDAAEPDFGWMVLGSETRSIKGHAIRSVLEFVEKPDEEVAQGLMEAGALWNTFVLAARVETLWNLGRAHAPNLVARFEELEPVIGSASEGAVLEAIYEDMPALSFSSAILQNAVGSVSAVRLDGVTWSDWGRPERILSTLDRLGLPAAFPRTAVQESVTGAAGVSRASSRLLPATVP